MDYVCIKDCGFCFGDIKHCDKFEKLRYKLSDIDES